MSPALAPLLQEAGVLVAVGGVGLFALWAFKRKTAPPPPKASRSEAASVRALGDLLEELKREGETLLHERDVFIAERIDATLREGETGILFLGLLHRVDELLDGKLEVRQLIHSLPFGADPWRRLRERDDHAG